MSRKTTDARVLKQREFDTAGRLSLGDGITLYKKPNSRKIWADLTLPGSLRKRISTKTVEVEIAEQFARRAKLDLKDRVLSGASITVSGPSVSDLLRAYLLTVKATLENGDDRVKPEVSVLKSYLPLWNDVALQDLSANLFLKKQDERKSLGGTTEIREYVRGNKTIKSIVTKTPPTVATIKREKVTFVRALAWGAQQVSPWLTSERVHEIRHAKDYRRPQKQKAFTSRARFALSDAEQERLFALFDKWFNAEHERAAREGKNGAPKNYQRRLMALQAKLLRYSGLRPGAEITEILWEDVRSERLANGQLTIVFSKCGDGKSGPRRVNCLPESIEVIRQLKNLLNEFGFQTAGKASLWPHPNGGVVRDMNNSFKSAMRKLGFVSASSKQPLYSLRHTYITDQLRKEVPINAIALNCGTSVEMIERFYTHVKSEQILNVLVPKDPKNILGLIL